MSALISRTGSHLRKFEKLFRGNSFILGVKAFKDARVAGMTSFSRVLASKESEQSGDGIVYDLTELVNKKAEEIILGEVTGILPTFIGKAPHFNLDWSEVMYKYDKIKETIKQGKLAQCTLLSTVLKNDSKVDQMHKLRLERQMSSQCDGSLIRGFKLDNTFVFNVLENIKLQLKNGVISSEDKLGWAYEDTITVPKGCTINVSISSEERESYLHFDTQIGVKGDAKATFIHPATDKRQEVTIPMKTLIHEEIPERMTKEEGDFTYIEIAGKVKIKQDLNHHVDVK